MSEKQAGFKPEMLSEITSAATRKPGQIYLNGGEVKTAMNIGEAFGEAFDDDYTELSKDPKNISGLFLGLEQQLRTEFTTAEGSLSTVRDYYVKKSPEEKKFTKESAIERLDTAKTQIANAMIQKESTESYLAQPEVQKIITSGTLSEEANSRLQALNDNLNGYAGEIDSLVGELKELYQAVEAS